MIKKIYTFCFFLGLFFFPFNEYQGLSFLGEFKSEAGAIFFIIGFLLLMIETGITKKISIPYRSEVFKTLFLFLIWCFVATLLNGSTVIDNYFKHTGGVNRFFRQYFALLLSSAVFFLFYWNILVKMEVREILFKIRRVFLYSLFVASIYGFLEILVVYFGIGFFYPVLKLFDYFPFLEVSLHGEGRISSISYEPPFFAIYLITIAGWMFSYILTERGFLKFIPTSLILGLTFFSGSRTALMVIFIQSLIFSIILFRDNRFRKYIINSVAFLFAIASILLVFNSEKVVKAISVKMESLDFKGNLKKNVSNQSRFGMQYASLQVFKENPITGVGFGQQAYQSRLHYPIWAKKNNYEFKLFYQNQNEKAFPPGYNIYTRLLAETGLIGIVLILMLIFISITITRIIIKKGKGEQKTLGIVLLLSFSGLYINWMQIDTFRIYGVWLSLAILIRVNQEMKLNE